MTEREPDSKSKRKPGKGGFRQAGAALDTGLRRAASRHGFAEPEVLMRWDEIAGPELAACCRPVAVRYGREKRLGATLVVRAPGALAVEVQHLGPRLLEKVNRHYGYRAVTRLKVEQTAGPPPGLAEPETPFAGKPKYDGPPPAARKRAEALAEDIDDPELREALTTLGAWVLSHPGPDTETRETT